MSSRPFFRLMVAGGIAIAAIGVYLASQSSRDFDLASVLVMIVIGVGVMLASIGLVNVLGGGEPESERQQTERSALPPSMLMPLFGAFMGLAALIAGLVVGHYLGRNEGVMTGILAFVVTNAVFGIGLAFARPSDSYR